MSGWRPPTVPRAWVAVIGAAYALFVLYSLFVTGEFLLTLVPLFALLSLYLAWRFLLAVEAIADALQRIAREREDRE